MVHFYMKELSDGYIIAIEKGKKIELIYNGVILRVWTKNKQSIYGKMCRAQFT